MRADAEFMQTTQMQGTSTATLPAPRKIRRSPAPAVSVIVPTYNRADLVTASLDSVAKQTFRDFEIIVVDDGSEDDTRDRIDCRPEMIRYIWQENQGVAEARNRALRITHSEFVAFLDSDDLWQPTFLERAIARLREQPDAAMVYTDFISVDGKGQPIRGHRKNPHDGDVTQALFTSTFIHTSAVVIRADVVRDAGGFDGRLTHNEDYDLWLRLSLRHRFSLINEPLCLRRCHHESLSRKGCSPDILRRKAELLEAFYDHGGGDEKIDPTLARQRIAKLYYTAAKAYLRSNKPKIARELFAESIRRNPGSLKPRLWQLRTTATSLLSRD